MIVTFDHTDTDLLSLFDVSRKKLIGMYSGKIIENYKVENFNYQDQTAFSIGYKNTSLLEWCNNRKMYYDPSSVDNHQESTARLVVLACWVL